MTLSLYETDFGNSPLTADLSKKKASYTTHQIHPVVVLRRGATVRQLFDGNDISVSKLTGRALATTRNY